MCAAGSRPCSSSSGPGGSDAHVERRRIRLPPRGARTGVDSSHQRLEYRPRRSLHDLVELSPACRIGQQLIGRFDSLKAKRSLRRAVVVGMPAPGLSPERSLHFVFACRCRNIEQQIRIRGVHCPTLRSFAAPQRDFADGAERKRKSARPFRALVRYADTMGITAGATHARATRSREEKGRSSSTRERLRGSGFFRPTAASGTHVDRLETRMGGRTHRSSASDIEVDL